MQKWYVFYLFSFIRKIPDDPTTELKEGLKQEKVYLFTTINAWDNSNNKGTLYKNMR